jgi:hypothetical protein
MADVIGYEYSFVSKDSVNDFLKNVRGASDNGFDGKTSYKTWDYDENNQWGSYNIRISKSANGIELRNDYNEDIVKIEDNKKGGSSVVIFSKNYFSIIECPVNVLVVKAKNYNSFESRELI